MKNRRFYCHSQNCFGEKGADIFELIGLKENLPKFADQKAWVEKIFGCTNGQPIQNRTITATYDYTDENGALLFQTVRYDPKNFRQRRPNEGDTWLWNLKDTQLVLYRLAEVLTATHVLILEGEKDVETAYQLDLPLGYAATTSPMGAGKWRDDYSECLRGKNIIICPDTDEPGQRHGHRIANALESIANEVLWVKLPHGKDLSEWIQNSGSAELFIQLLKTAQPPSDSLSEGTKQDESSQQHFSLGEVVLDFSALCALQLPERKILFPFLPEGGTAMAFGPRGVGKTFFNLSMAASLCTGTPFFRWAAPPPTGVLYVDGEMDLDELRNRMTALLPEPPKAPLAFLTSHYVFHKLGCDLILTEEEVRQDITSIFDSNPILRVLILDNISCLFSGIDEDRKRDWEPIGAWLVRLRHRGITTLVVHHAGKGGQQRGTSGREDSLDTVIQINRPAGYSQTEGCHFEITFTKCRSSKGDDLEPLDAKLEETTGRLEWTWKSLAVSKEEQAEKLFNEGVTSPTELAEELGITKGYASKLIRKTKEKEGAL